MASRHRVDGILACREGKMPSPRFMMRISRRHVLSAAGGIAAFGITDAIALADGSVIHKGRINQSVCQWCYKDMSVEDLARNAARLGLKGIDLVGPEHFAILKKYNLIGTLCTAHSIPKGLNR